MFHIKICGVRRPDDIEAVEISGADGESATEVWVEFIDFQTGHREQIRTA
jgi:hypothetical protein